MGILGRAAGAALALAAMACGAGQAEKSAPGAFAIDGKVWLRMPKMVKEAFYAPKTDLSKPILRVNGNPVLPPGELIRTPFGVYLRIDAKGQAYEDCFRDNDDKDLPGKIALETGEKTEKVMESGREWLCIEMEGKLPAKIEIDVIQPQKRFTFELKPREKERIKEAGN